MKKKKVLIEKCKCNGAIDHIYDDIYRCANCGKDVKRIIGIPQFPSKFKPKPKKIN